MELQNVQVLGETAPRDGVVYGTSEDAMNMAEAFQKMKKGTDSTPNSAPVHEGVVLTRHQEKMSIQDTRLGIPIYLRERQWTKVKTLEKGENSVVYKGQDHHKSQQNSEGFAVKMEDLDDFKSLEVVSWLQFSHDNIPELYAVVREEEKVLLFCEAIEGQQLNDYLESTAWTDMHVEEMERFIREIGQQVGSAVTHIHTKGFTHNDVICQNVMVDQHRKVWVVDYGDVLKKDDDGCRMDMLCVDQIVDTVKLAYHNKKKTIKGNILPKGPPTNVEFPMSESGDTTNAAVATPQLMVQGANDSGEFNSGPPTDVELPMSESGDTTNAAVATPQLMVQGANDGGEFNNGAVSASLSPNEKLPTETGEPGQNNPKVENPIPNIERMSIQDVPSEEKKGSYM